VSKAKIATQFGAFDRKNSYDAQVNKGIVPNQMMGNTFIKNASNII
jgi:hypothetical protein